MPSPAISALIQVQGFDSAWDGDMLAGSLLGQSLFRLRMIEGRVVYSERIPLGVRIRDLHQHTDGRIVVWTDELRLIFISPQPRIDHTARLNTHIDYWDFTERRAERLPAVANCAQCHSFKVGDHAKSPSLARIYGSPIGATSYPAYSGALKAKGGTWTREALIAYLTDPQGFAPGTSMSAQPFPDRQTLDDLLGYLEGIEQDF
jgi:cytochrome c2